MLERLAIAAVMSMVAAACGGGEDRCASTVAKLMGGTPKGDTFAALSPEEKAKKLALRERGRAAVTASCRKESWSKEFFDCIAASDGSKSGDRACDARLTPAQQAAAKAALEEVASEAGQGQAQDPEPKEPSREDEIAANAAKLEAARRAAEAATTEAERAAAAAEIEKLERRRRLGEALRPECIQNPLAAGC